MYGGADYDHPEQNALVREHRGRFVSQSFVWNSGGDAPEYGRLRFVTLSRRPIRIRNVTFRPVEGELVGWRLESAWSGLGGEGVLCTTGEGVSQISRKVMVEPDTEYAVELEVRGGEGLRVELRNAAGGAERLEREGVAQGSGKPGYTRVRFVWRSGLAAGGEAELRLSTDSRRPVQVRHIRWEGRRS